jgi:hypothetical protein
MQRFASDVWHVLQSHPPHKQIVLGLERLGSQDGREHVRSMLDLNNPYRLLYTTQILDSMLTYDKIRTARFKDICVESVTIAASSLSWSLEFISIGGAEHLSNILFQICHPDYEARVSFREHTNPPVEQVVDGDALSSVNRSDVSVLTLVMILRVLHKVLMVDPAYRTAVMPSQSGSKSPLPDNMKSFSNTVFPPSSPALFVVSAIEFNIPSGLVTSLIDIPAMISTLTSYAYSVLRTERNFACSVASKEALVQHVLTISFNLLSLLQNSEKDIVETLPQFSDIIQRVQKFLILACAYENSSSVRKTSCRLILGHFLSTMLVNPLFEIDGKDASNRYAFWINFFSDVILHESLEVCVRQEHVSALLAAAVYFGKNSGVVLNITQDFVNSLLKKLAESADSFPQTTVDVTGSLYDSYLLVESDRDQAISAYLSAVTISMTESFDNFDDIFLGAVVNFIYRNCLFSEATKNPICCSPMSRRLAYNFLLVATKIKVNALADLIQSIQTESEYYSDEHCSSVAVSLKLLQAPPLSLWNYNPVASMKTQRFVGLINQGATCYMNSFLQQLFRIESFSNRLLELPDEKVEEGPDTDSKVIIVRQFKLLIGNLKLSEKAVFDTLPFCSTLRDYTGEKINLSEQKDTYEVIHFLD